MDTRNGEWVVTDVVRAKAGTRVVWFTDPNDPPQREVAMWACANKEEQVGEGTFKIVTDVLPMIMLGGRMHLCDDYDLILNPHQSIDDIDPVTLTYPWLN